MLVCLGTALWPMAAHGYDVIIEAVALATILWAVASRGSQVPYAIAGLVVGAAVSTRYGAAILVIPAAVALVCRQENRSSILTRGLAFTAGCMPGLLLFLWHNDLRSGSPLVVHKASPTGIPLNEFVVPWFSWFHAQGMAGLTVSPGKGLLWYGPPILGVILFARPIVLRYERWRLRSICSQPSSCSVDSLSGMANGHGDLATWLLHISCVHHSPGWLLVASNPLGPRGPSAASLALHPQWRSRPSRSSATPLRIRWSGSTCPYCAQGCSRRPTPVYRRCRRTTASTSRRSASMLVTTVSSVAQSIEDPKQRPDMLRLLLLAMLPVLTAPAAVVVVHLLGRRP